MKNCFYLLFIFLVFLYSCKEETNSKYPGFSKSSGGIYYKLHIAGDGNTTPTKGDLIRIKLDVSSKDSLLKDLNGYAEENDHDTLTLADNIKGGLNEVIRLMNEGDSASFIFENGITGNIKLAEISTKDELKKIKLSEALFYQERKQDEYKILENYLKEKGIPFNTGDSVVYQSLRNGTGRIAMAGRSVAIHYRATFLDGKEFFSTYDKNEPFEFTLGTPGQVLRGIEIGLQRMREGGKAQLIVPSEFAFGSKGSSTGMVGPFKTLIFEIELLKIN